MVRFLIMMTCICAKLVSAAHANQFIKSHWIYVCAFLVLYLKTMSLSSLKIKKSLITEYNDPRHQNLKTKQETWTHQTGDHVHVPCMIYHKNHPFFKFVIAVVEPKVSRMEITCWHSKCWTTYPSTVIIPCLLFACTAPQPSMTSPNLGKRKDEQ
jgi:hypothetical protein